MPCIVRKGCDVSTANCEACVGARYRALELFKLDTSFFDKLDVYGSNENHRVSIGVGSEYYMTIENGQNVYLKINGEIITR